MIVIVNPLFPLGQCVSTPGALAALEAANAHPAAFIHRHSRGDWGELCDEDKAANRDAIRYGSRILSAYVLEATKVKIWVITEADRSATTILLPSEY